MNINKTNKLVKKHDNSIGLIDRDYHIHKKNIERGDILLEIKTFRKICKKLDINIDSLSERQLFLCYEHISDAILISFNKGKESKRQCLKINNYKY